MADKFLGRTDDHGDMRWKYLNGSGGAIPEECRIEMFAQIDGMKVPSFARTRQRYKNGLTMFVPEKDSKVSL
jgi:hypothetical protein